VCCRVLRCVVVEGDGCDALVQTHCKWLESSLIGADYAAECGRVLQCAAVCCGVLRCVAVCCSVLQCVAVCCSVLQGVAVCCSVLQCVTVCAVRCSDPKCGLNFL